LIIDVTGKKVKVTPDDFCLEFVIGPNGYQIPYTDTLPGQARAIRTVFDPNVWVPEPQVGDNYTPLDAGPWFCPENRVPAGGEDQIVYWAPLNWWRSW
jgi:hypothetical protein